MKRKIVLSCLIIFLTLSCVILSFALWSQNYFYSSNSLDKEKILLIKQGLGAVEISKELADAQIIKYPKIFTLISVITKQNKQIKAGEYLFEAGISPQNVLNKLVKNQVYRRKITIPEGLTVRQVLRLIDATGHFVNDTNGKNITEGSLLPETYDYVFGDSKSKILKQMQALMVEKAMPLWDKRDPFILLKNLDEAIVLASIVEKETGLNDERTRVAAVFYNRLRLNMRLQSDPTVLYAINQNRDIETNNITKADLAYNSPFNTYVNVGLPPLPIANPGIDSIKAVLNPEKSDELYFVANGKGGHNFAKTLEEHNNNVRNWLKTINNNN